MIRLSELSEKDKGRWVIWKDPNDIDSDTIGRIKSWNDKFVFVVYKCDNRWDRYEEYTGIATNPEELEFLEDKLVTIRKHDCGQEFLTEDVYTELKNLRELFVAYKGENGFIMYTRPKRFVTCPLCGKSVSPFDCEREVELLLLHEMICATKK